MTILTTARLTLRPARVGDEVGLHRAFTDPEAMRYWSTLPHTDIAQTRHFVEGMIWLKPEDGEEFIVEKDGEVIGKAGFWRWPEIGFILVRDHWGQGLASEAVTALIAHAFETRGLDEVVADVDPNNAASIALLEKLGFVETGREALTLQIGEAWFDSVYFALRNPN